MTARRAHARKKTAGKKATGRKRSQSGGAGPEGGISETAHDDAMRVLRAEYYQGVRGITAMMTAAVKEGEIKSQDDWETWIHQTIDGSYWVIYTHANFQVLMCSDHHDAYSEEFGEAPVSGADINWAALAFAALQRDVRDQVSAEGIEPNWDNFEGGSEEMREAHRGRSTVDAARGLSWLASGDGKAFTARGASGAKYYIQKEGKKWVTTYDAPDGSRGGRFSWSSVTDAKKTAASIERDVYAQRRH